MPVAMRPHILVAFGLFHQNLGFESDDKKGVLWQLRT